MLNQCLYVGLTGGIASGKSTVSRILIQCGAQLVDADLISFQLAQESGAAIPAIKEVFGGAFLDANGALNRKMMRDLIFSSDVARAKLEGILHPLLERECLKRAALYSSGVVVFDLPLLVESERWRYLVDQILVVDCSEATQLIRLSTRQGWSEELGRSVIATQASRAKRLDIADAVIFNENMQLDVLVQQVTNLWHTKFQ